MSRLKAVLAWEQTVSRRVPHLSQPQATVLALWSYGVALAQCCGQTNVLAMVAPLLGQRVGRLARDSCGAPPRHCPASAMGPQLFPPGLATRLTTLLAGLPLPAAYLVPDPWPT